MIEEMVGFLATLSLFVTIVAAISVCNRATKKVKSKIAYIKRLRRAKRDKLVKRELMKILKQMSCKWDDKVECRQNRECDYCSEIKCLRKQGNERQSCDVKYIIGVDCATSNDCTAICKPFNGGIKNE